jgi:hypothetical protein
MAHRQDAPPLGRYTPGDLPILDPTAFELIINLNPSWVLGLTVALSTLARADEVIE